MVTNNKQRLLSIFFSLNVLIISFYVSYIYYNSGEWVNGMVEYTFLNQNLQLTKLIHSESVKVSMRYKESSVPSSYSIDGCRDSKEK